MGGFRGGEEGSGVGKEEVKEKSGLGGGEGDEKRVMDVENETPPRAAPLFGSSPSAPPAGPKVVRRSGPPAPPPGPPSTPVPNVASPDSGSGIGRGNKAFGVSPSTPLSRLPVVGPPRSDRHPPLKKGYSFSSFSSTPDPSVGGVVFDGGVPSWVSVVGASVNLNDCFVVGNVDANSLAKFADVVRRRGDVGAVVNVVNDAIRAVSGVNKLAWGVFPDVTGRERKRVGALGSLLKNVAGFDKACNLLGNNGYKYSVSDGCFVKLK